jgi:hypothetical protein
MLARTTWMCALLGYLPCNSSSTIWISCQLLGPYALFMCLHVDTGSCVCVTPGKLELVCLSSCLCCCTSAHQTPYALELCLLLSRIFVSFLFKMQSYRTDAVSQLVEVAIVRTLPIMRNRSSIVRNAHVYCIINQNFQSIYQKLASLFWRMQIKLWPRWIPLVNDHV